MRWSFWCITTIYDARACCSFGAHLYYKETGSSSRLKWIEAIKKEKKNTSNTVMSADMFSKDRK